MFNAAAAVILISTLTTPAVVAATPPAVTRAVMIDAVRQSAMTAGGIGRSTPVQTHRRAANVVAGAFLGAVAGVFAGGFVGYKIERGFGDCRCDDPGLRGIIIGVPIGAIVGGVLGGKLLFK
jgi:hypothetical protein